MKSEKSIMSFKQKEIRERGFLFHLFNELKKVRADYSKVVDIGGYTGDNLILAAQEGIHFNSGLVIDPKPSAFYKSELRALNVKIIKGYAESLQLKSNSIDLVFLIEVIEHLIEPDKSIKRIHNILKDNGILALSTPNLACIWNRILLVLGFQPIFSEVSSVKVFGRPGKEVVGHLHIYTFSSIQEFLKYYNFEIISIKTLPLFKGGFLHEMTLPLLKGNFLLGIIESFFILLHPSFGSRIIIIAKKRKTK
jgi:SAM-dependent methyltransferase